MAKARCLNENCNKEPWVLRKSIDEYSGSGPSCPECGSTRVEVVGQAQEQQPATPERQQAQAGELTELKTEGDIAAEGVAGATKGVYALVGNMGDRESADLLGEGLENLKNGITGFYRLQQAKKETAENVELGEPEKVYPECECGFIFRKIDPNATHVDCPECGRRYPVEVQAAPT